MNMSDSELDYLQDDFDPKSLTVPRLRSILVTYNVQYPTTSKKPQLIDLFNEHIVPQTKRLRADRARVKRMSHGIVDAGTQESTHADVFSADVMPPPSTRKTPARSRSPRKSSRVAKSEPEEPAHRYEAARPVRESPRKRSSRSTSVQPPTASDTDTGRSDLDVPRSTRRRGRTTPAVEKSAVKVEPLDEDGFCKLTLDTESVFTSDNPFQTPGKAPSTRRKTMGVEPVRTKTLSVSRRRTDVSAQYEDNEFIRDHEVAASSLIEQPTSGRAKSMTPVPEPQLELFKAGEEFTPDEQLAMEQEKVVQPELAVARQRPASTGPKRTFATLILVLIISLLGAYAAWYRQEKMAIGYCGLGRETRQMIPSHVEWPGWILEAASKAYPDFGLSNIKVPESVQSFTMPECEPCPAHAFCYENLMTRCEQDYIIKRHPLSLGGLIPLVPSCEPDGEKVKRVQAVADVAVEELRSRRAKYECGEPFNEQGRALETPAVTEKDLKAFIDKKRNKRMSRDEFDDLWTAAIGDVKARGEIEVEEAEEAGDSGSFPTVRLSSTSLAGLSYACATRRSLKLGLARYRLSIVGLAILTWIALYGRSRFRESRAVAKQIPKLVDEVLERLSTQKELAFEDNNAYDAFLFLPNLRDDVLRHMHSLAARERVWRHVRQVVEQNSNVRTGQRESRHSGEVGRAWEWIGPSRGGVGDVAGLHLSGSSKRKSGRLSWAPTATMRDDDDAASEGSPAFAKSIRDASGVGKKGITFNKWGERKRPVY